MPKLSIDKIRKHKISKPKPSIWQGPCSEDQQGGITNSLLERYLCCPERFRIMVMEGLRSKPDFSPSMHYGQMWHICEEHVDGNWDKALRVYCRELQQEFRTAGNMIQHWYNVCKTQFPIYLNYWSKNPDVKKREIIEPECEFRVPYHLPSGRIVYLRGKRDSLDRIGREGIFLQENKTKGDIDPVFLRRRLLMDCQTMLYFVATQAEHPDMEIKGIRYNVVRRPLAGGKHSIRQKIGQSADDFYAELGGRIEDECKEAIKSKGKQDCFFFYRWKVDIQPSCITKFKDQVLHPVLENLCDDYEWWDICKKSGASPFDYNYRLESFPNHQLRHYRLPFGIYNPMLEGRGSDLDEYMDNGLTTGLVKVTNLFPELSNA